MEEVQYARGLKDVVFDKTVASFIDGNVGKLLYRGYDIHDLAENATFEEVLHLLLYGNLPNQQELESLNQKLISERSIPDEIIDVIKVVKSAHPMDVLRTATSALSAFDPDVKDNSVEATRVKGIRLTAKAPTIVAAHHRIRQGLDVVSPSNTLSHAGNFLYMLFDEEPDPDDAKLLDVDFVLHSEHGSNASAFAARVTASTISDLHSAVVTGIGTLKGPAHGGAAEEVMKMALDIGNPENAPEYVKKVLDGGGRVMGFGHRVYRAEDPRARHLKQRALDLGEKKQEPQWYQILVGVQEAMKPYQSRGIFVNVDFFAGTIYYLLGIPEDLFIPIFALGRVPGWTLQVMEQFEDNILLRPLLDYVGPMDVEFKPLDQRTA